MDRSIRKVQIKTNSYASLVDKTIECIERLSGSNSRGVGLCLQHLQRLMKIINKDRCATKKFQQDICPITAKSCRELIEEAMQFINTIFPNILSQYTTHINIAHQGLVHSSIEDFIALHENVLINALSILAGKGELSLYSEDIYLQQAHFIHFEYKISLKDRQLIALAPQAIAHCVASCKNMSGHSFTKFKDGFLSYSFLLPTFMI